MNASMEPHERSLHIIAALAKELSTEIDLHYDPKDYRKLGATVAQIANAILHLKEQEFPVPDEVESIIERFVRSSH